MFGYNLYSKVSLYLDYGIYFTITGAKKITRHRRLRIVKYIISRFHLAVLVKVSLSSDRGGSRKKGVTRTPGSNIDTIYVTESYFLKKYEKAWPRFLRPTLNLPIAELTYPVNVLFILIVVTVFRKTNCQRIFLCKFALMFSGGFLK